jgi:hypothetical protein
MAAAFMQYERRAAGALEVWGGVMRKRQGRSVQVVPE